MDDAVLTPLIILVCTVLILGWMVEMAWPRISGYFAAIIAHLRQEPTQEREEAPEAPQEQPAPLQQPIVSATGDSITIRTQTGASVWNRVQNVPATPPPAPSATPVRWTTMHQRVLGYLRQNPAISAFELQQKIYPGTSRGRKTTEINAIMQEVKAFLNGNGTRNVPVPGSSSNSEKETAPIEG